MDEFTTKREYCFVSAPRRSRAIYVSADGLACTYLVQQQGDGRVKNVEINGKTPRAAWKLPVRYTSQPWMARGPSCSKSRSSEW